MPLSCDGKAEQVNEAENDEEEEEEEMEEEGGWMRTRRLGESCDRWRRQARRPLSILYTLIKLYKCQYRQCTNCRVCELLMTMTQAHTH